ncbi:MAG: biotin/lipoyl-binding protein [Prosthecobacter sp.]|nr:biotin/lipoyl-binding protein [Prosthecobacter sp.]
MKLFPSIVRYGSMLLAIAGVIGMGLVLQTIRAKENQIPPPPVTPPAKPYTKGVAATGILEAFSENVSIGTPVSGLVREIPDNIKVNATVKEGDVLFLLDDRELRAQLLHQQAAVAVARANIDVARAQLVKTEDMLKSVLSVPDQRAISQDDLRNRTNDVAVGKAQLAAAEAQLLAASAEVQQSELMIERLTVRAPKNATILQLNIREGEFAAPTNRVSPIVLGDLTSFQVRTDVDEQNAPRIHAKQGATAFLKGDSKTGYPLKFVRIEPYVIPKISLTGASTERVDTRVLQVIYELKAPSGKPLYVGQQVDVFIEE